MSSIHQRTTDKMELIFSIERKAQEFASKLVKQLEPALLAVMEPPAQAVSEYELQELAEHLCDFDPDNPPANPTALCQQMITQHQLWGFSGFDFFGMDDDEDAAVLAFGSSQLMTTLEQELGEVPLIGFRFTMVDDATQGLALTGTRVIGIHLMDMADMMAFQGVWDRWVEDTLAHMEGSA